MNKYFAAILGCTILFGSIVYAQIDGKNGEYVKNNEANRVMSTFVTTQYGNKEFALPPAASDYDVQANQSLFNATTFTRAHYVSIRTDATITVKFNSVGNDAITITAAESPFQNSRLEYTNIFLSSTPGANVKIWVQ